MHISFIKHNPSLSSSCKSLSEYLEKENYGREKNLELFFEDVEEAELNNYDEQLEKQNRFFTNDVDQKEVFLNQNEATDLIDNNSSSRHTKNRSNFFMVNISPSKEELDHLKKIVDQELSNNGIGEKERRILEESEVGKKQLELMWNDLMHQAMREYAKDVMRDYAENFDRTVYVSPNNLPNQREEKIINSETKKELEKLKIDRKHPEYSEQYQKIREAKAEELGRELRVRKLTANDLVWFGKVEETRTYKPNDKWVIENRKSEKKISEIKNDKNLSVGEKAKKIDEIKSKMHKDRATGEVVREGMKKGGDQYHVHIVVSRYDNCPNKRYKGSISPVANHKNSKIADKEAKVGFHRDLFFQKVEKSFDEKFQYKRPEKLSYQSHKSTKANRRERIRSGVSLRRSGQTLLQPVKTELMKNSGMQEISKLNIMNNVSAELGFRIPMSIPKTPMDAAVKIIRTGIQKINEVSKGI